MAEGLTGGTTVAATMIAARLAGIEVFATGGIGGVHKGAEESFDISADLDELARTPVIVVSAGAKAILDIEKTLEVLETRGVPVVAYRHRRNAGLLVAALRASPRRSGSTSRGRSPASSATRTALGLDGGLLVANPVPEADEISAETMAGHIAAAQDKAADETVTGKAVTPFLLAEDPRACTGGASLEDQHRAGQEQCPAGGADRRRAGRLAALAIQNRWLSRTGSAKA